MNGSAALKQAEELSARSFSSTDRRRYFEHLLTLPSYKSPPLNTYYARNISRDFTEFEDLQDQAVDAVLDLCEDEDEQTRISGIQALAEIGKVEPRWVRGNTGVLLQLLECPPAELRHVKKALFTLLDVSPSEVFSIMAEDCKGSEADTGASRRNILEFLNTDAKAKRRELLESGKYIEAEQTFSAGFYDVLTTTAIAETRMILGLLLPLSIISGRNSTKTSSGRYAKTLIRCLHPKSSMGMTIPLIKLWEDFAARADGLDPRWTLCFLADHGAAVVQAAMEKGDKEAKSILQYPNTNSSSRFRRYFDDRDRDRSDPELETRKLVPLFAQTMLDSALRYATKTSTETMPILELIVYGVYTIITLDRHTREYIPKPLSRQLVEFGELAERNKRNTKDERLERAWRNLMDMAEIMADRDEKVYEVKPSWTIKVRTKSRSRSPTKVSSRPPVQVSSTTRDPASKEEVPRVEPVRQRQPTPPLPEVKVPAPIPTAPRAPATATNVSKPAEASIVRPIQSMPSVPSPVMTVPAALPEPVTAAASTPGLSIRSRANEKPVVASSPAAINAPADQAPAASTIRPSPVSAPGLSILARAKQSPAPSSPGISIRSAATPRLPPAEPPRPPSLLSRMSASSLATNTNNKRTRDDDTTTTTNETPIEKKVKAAPSLLARMSGQGISQPSSPITASASAGPGLTIKRSGTALPAVPTSTSISGLVPATSPGSGFSIKNRATLSSSINTKSSKPPSADTPVRDLRIRRDAPAPSIEVDDDTPIIRKGRGFARVSEQFGKEILVTPPTTKSVAAATIDGQKAVKGLGLADRLGLRKNRFG